MHTIFAVLSSAIGISCFIPYFRDVFRHKTTPHSYSWLIWAILQGTIVSVMLVGGAGIGVLSLSVGTVLCGLVFILSLRYGTNNITTFDTICFTAAMAAIGVYIFIKDPFLSVAMVTAIDLVAFMPTLRKTYHEPYSETVSTYFMTSISSFFALGALPVFTVITSLFLISQVFINIISVGIILVCRKYKI